MLQIEGMMFTFLGKENKLLFVDLVLEMTSKSQDFGGLLLLLLLHNLKYK